MNYFEASARKRSREDDVFMTTEIMKKNQRKHGGMQMVGQTTNSGSCDLIAIIDAIERPKVGGGGEADGSRGATKRADDFFASDKGSEFRLSEFSDRLLIDELSTEAFGCGFGLGVVDCLLEEQLCLGWFPFSDADLVGFYGEQVCYEDGDGGDFGPLSLWDDDIWQLRQIHETPPRRKEM